MARTKLAWGNRDDAGPVEIGTMTRFRESKSHPWEYAIWRSRDGRAATFSDTPTGPITMWRMCTPRYQQMAYVAREPDGNTTDVGDDD